MGRGGPTAPPKLSRRRHGSPTDRPLDAVRARLTWWWHERTAVFFAPITPRCLRWTWVRHLPELPFRKPRVTPAWPSSRGWQTPEQLRTVAGALVDRDEQERVLREGPALYDFFARYPEAPRVMRFYGWGWQLASLRIFRKWIDQIEATKVLPEVQAPAEVDAKALTEEIRAEGLRLGLAAVGFTAFDPKYAFVGTPGATGELREGTVIVCMLEQDWEATQLIPSVRSERSVMKTYLQLAGKTRRLADFLHERGHEAELHGPDRLAAIPYAVQAGLGQLGLNGQLLTPTAGSRARIFLLTTDATLVHDEPIDFGVHVICDECQLCVKRCPSGAIPKKRASHRGVIKAKIKPDRCLPVLAQAHGCAVCMKVCPVQRYGLEAVTTHLIETGEILGKGTDELEGYRWIDGRHYGPGQKPRITREFMRPLGLVMDPNQEEPPVLEPGVEVEHVLG